jgi:predicted DNA-binding transcriptional regulator YafY
LLKLNRVLPAALRRRVATLVGATAVIGSRPPAAAPDPEVTLTLPAAGGAGRRVRIEHTRPEGRRTTRDVDPYGLVVHGRRWYVVGHDHLRDAVRTFRVDRITSAADLPHRFTPPPGFDPVGHVTRALALDAWTHRTEVWLDTDIATARRRLPATAGELHSDPAGGVLLVSGVESLPGMAQLLAGLPWRFTIRRPVELVDAVAKHVAALAEAVARGADR